MHSFIRIHGSTRRIANSSSKRSNRNGSKAATTNPASRLRAWRVVLTYLIANANRNGLGTVTAGLGIFVCVRHDGWLFCFVAVVVESEGSGLLLLYIFMAFIARLVARVVALLVAGGGEVSFGRLVCLLSPPPRTTFLALTRVSLARPALAGFFLFPSKKIRQKFGAFQTFETTARFMNQIVSHVSHVSC